MNLNVTPPPCRKACMAVNALNASDSNYCEAFTDAPGSDGTNVCPQGARCAWKST